MKNAIVSFLLFISAGAMCFSQSDSQRIVYFNRFFESEKELEYFTYYGVPKKIKGRLYEVTLYTLSDEKAALGEYLGRRLKNRHGLFVLYNREGKIIVSANYRKNILHGVYQRFHNNGFLSDSGYVSRGRNQGVWKTWFDNGNIREIKNYTIGRTWFGYQYSYLEKEYKSWFRNGRLDDSGYYKANNREGIWVDWIENGSIRSVGVYKRNWKRGTWRYYDTKGKLLYMRRFSSFRYDDVGVYVPLNRQNDPNRN